MPVIKNFSNNYKDLVPFKSVKEAPAIMVSHILIKGYTDVKPASLSKNFVTNFLKKENKYEGLVITDELGMRAVRLFYGKNKCVRMAYEAGNDIICCKYDDNYVNRLIESLSLLYKYDNEIITKSYQKVVDYKTKYNLNDKLVDFKLDIEKINKEIDQINELPE